MVLLFFTIYHFASRVTGFCFFPGEMVPGGIEKLGGAALGFVRSIFIIGVILIGLVLTPIKFVEASVKNSCLGIFYINTSLRIYGATASLIFRGKKVSHKEKMEELFLKKQKYLFKAE
jgi:hypothetical protein